MTSNIRKKNKWKIAFWVQLVVFVVIVLLMFWGIMIFSLTEIYADTRSDQKSECLSVLIEYMPYLNRGLSASDLADTLQAAFPDRSIAYTGDYGVVIGDCCLEFSQQGDLLNADHFMWATGD